MPRIVWELRDGEPAGFRALQTRCDGMSTSVLRARLVELQEARLVDQDRAGAYRLTAKGLELAAALSRWLGSAPARPRRGPASR